jgi:mRNA interferase RelE/StbE
MWTIEFTPKSKKELKRLAFVDQRRIADFLADRVTNHENPRLLAKRLTVPDEELWRFRVGNFRIVVRFIDQKMEIVVIAVGHRSQVYRP